VGQLEKVLAFHIELVRKQRPVLGISPGTGCLFSWILFGAEFRSIYFLQ